MPCLYPLLCTSGPGAPGHRTPQWLVAAAMGGNRCR